jgi:hypothetical protein
MSIIGIVLVVLLILILLGGLAPLGWHGAPYAYGYGFHHGGIGVIGVLLIVLLILALTGRV